MRRWMIIFLLILLVIGFLFLAFTGLRPWINLGAAVVLLAMVFWLGSYQAKVGQFNAPLAVLSVLLSILSILVALQDWHIPIPASAIVERIMIVAVFLLSLYNLLRPSNFTRRRSTRR